MLSSNTWLKFIISCFNCQGGVERPSGCWFSSGCPHLPPPPQFLWFENMHVYEALARFASSFIYFPVIVFHYNFQYNFLFLSFFSHTSTTATDTLQRQPVADLWQPLLPEVVGGRLMFFDDRRRLVVRELHRQPLADLRQPLFFFFGGGVFFGGIRWSAKECRWSPTNRRLVCDWL